MMKQTQNIPDFGVNPPMMPGEKILNSSSMGGVYPKFDANEPTKLIGWMFFWRDKEFQLADENENFYSQLHQVVDGNTGRDLGCIVGEENIYIIKANDANDNLIINALPQQIDLPSFQTLKKCFNFHFLPCVYPISSSTFLKEMPVEQVFGEAPNVRTGDTLSFRLLYTCQGFLKSPSSSLNANNYSISYDYCYLQDAYDKSFKINLPFVGEKIKNCKRVSSAKKTYIIFFVIEPVSENICSVILYAIEETTLLLGKDFKKEDFVSYTTKVSYTKHEDDNIDTIMSTLDVVVASFFRDDANVGAHQMVIAAAQGPSELKEGPLPSQVNVGDTPYAPENPINSSGGAKVSMEFVALSMGQSFVSYDCISLTGDFGGPQPNQFGMYNLGIHHLRNPDSSSTIFFAGHHMVGADEGSPFDTGGPPPPYSNYNYYRVQMVFVDIDFSNRKLVLRSSENNAVFQLMYDPFTSIRYPIHSMYKDYLIASYPYCFSIACYPKYQSMDEKNPSVGQLLGYDVYFRPIQKNSLTNDTSEGLVPFAYQWIDSSDHDGKYYIKWQTVVLNGPISPPKAPPLKDTHVSNLVFKNANVSDNLSPFYTVGAFIHQGLDFYGESLIVGNPSFTLNHNINQVFALYQCPPHEDGIATTIPSLNISNSASVMNGITKSTTSSWQASINVDCSLSGTLLGFFTGSVSAHFSHSWGETKMHMSSDQETESIHISTTFSNTDGLHAYMSDFYVWQYPVFCRQFSVDPVGFLTLLIPDGFSDVTLDTGDKDFYYVQDYQIGKLLSYVDAESVGFDKSNLWFTKEVLTCSGDATAGGSSLTYNKDNSEQKEDEVVTDDMTNAGGGITGGFLGTGFSVSANYTKNDIRNSATSTTKSKDISFSFHSGIVKDQAYEYTITPLVYSHKDEKTLLISYEVNLDGAEWQQYFQRPDIMLMALYPFSEIPGLKSFTRSIRFQEQSDGTVDIDIHLFNNSLSQSLGVIVRVYIGMPVITPEKPADFSYCTLLGNLNVAPLGPAKRVISSLLKQKISKNTIISLEVYQDGLEDESKKYYWGAYPFDYFSHKDEILEGMNKM